MNSTRVRIIPDVFGWFLIMRGDETLQAFRTEKECRQWLADTWRVRRLDEIALERIEGEQKCHCC